MAPGGSSGSLHILLAEDNELNRLVATGILTRRGHRVTSAHSGRQAVDLLARERFDLVLMDVQMPDMNGLEATAAIRRRERADPASSSPRPPRVPILALTAADTPAELDACLAAGMDGHLTKPLRPATLWQEIDRVLAGAAARAPETSTPTARAEAPLDLPALLEQAGGDRGLLARLVDIFREQSGELGGQLRQAVAGGDAATVHQKAHALKSLIGHWGRGAAFQLAGRLEALGGQGDAPALPPVYDDLVAALKRLDDQLSELTARLGAPQLNRDSA